MAHDKSLKVYKPRMTIHKRGMNFNLVVEFSAPKILFNNNVDELEDKDFDEALRRLKEKMLAMGVLVNLNNLKNAEVLAFHPSKNIPLTKGYTATFAIRELSKIDVSQKFDISKIKFRNNGEELQLYTNSHSIVFYDKIADLKNPEHRAVDKQQTKFQRSLFDYLKEKNRIELLRLEIRLSKKVKMNEILKKVDHAPNPLFKDVFKKDLCQKIVNWYWNEFFNSNQFIFSTTSNPQEILQLIFLKYPKVKTLNAIKAVGLYALCRDKEGIRGFRQVIDNYRSKTNWEVVKNNLKMFEDEIFTNSTWDFVKDIKQELKNFKPFRLKN
ncbi:MAG: hypothetical protein WCK11_02025 [Candidatus Falkowbacteria bacterium]